MSRLTGIDAYHQEVVEALQAIGDPRFGEAVRRDRRSQMVHLGIPFPVLRRRVKIGFSFYSLPEAETLAVWDALWATSPYADVLFAALEYYGPRVRKQVSPGLWPAVQHWADRVDNWCHSDGLCAIYSRILERYPDQVWPRLREWNVADAEWLRRISLVSLIHYTGKNAVFLPPSEVLSLVHNCLGDRRYYVEMAVGWVLREMARAHPTEIGSYLEANASAMSARALSRAAEAMAPDQRAQLRSLRKTGGAGSPSGNPAGSQISA